jgi:hypothetical protein
MKQIASIICLIASTILLLISPQDISILFIYAIPVSLIMLGIGLVQDRWNHDKNRWSKSRRPVLPSTRFSAVHDSSSRHK